ncbi:hypothetical protein ABZ916_24210 [Streptomyces sp. NPDC046853]|uniref:hypothetical protein n=1 Tax=Streptomyces sp. NPDC046853 TaxID=3154920 RepID=UPI0033C0686B
MSDAPALTALLTRRRPPRGVAMAALATAVFLVIPDSTVGIAGLAGIADGASGTHGDISFAAAFLGQTALVLITFALSLVSALRAHPATAAAGTH